MSNFEERIKEFQKRDYTGTFIDIMSVLDIKLRNWIVLDLHDITGAACWTIIYRWGKGKCIPGKLEQEAIANYFNKSKEQLFP